MDNLIIRGYLKKDGRLDINMNISDELINKAKSVKSIDELKKLAEESGVELTEELEAKYRSMHTEGEISDDELSNVSGGCGGDDDDEPEPEPEPVQVRVLNKACGNYRRDPSNTSKLILNPHCMDCYYCRGSKTWTEIDDNHSPGDGYYCFFGLV